MENLDASSPDRLPPTSPSVCASDTNVVMSLARAPTSLLAKHYILYIVHRTLYIVPTAPTNSLTKTNTLHIVHCRQADHPSDPWWHCALHCDQQADRVALWWSPTLQSIEDCTTSYYKAERMVTGEGSCMLLCCALLVTIGENGSNSVTLAQWRDQCSTCHSLLLNQKVTSPLCWAKAFWQQGLQNRDMLLKSSSIFTKGCTHMHA